MNGIVITSGAFLLLGVLVGIIHAGLLYRAVTMLAGVPGREAAVVALHAARLGLAIAAFWLIAQAGAPALIAAAAGFTIALIAARQIVGRA